MFMPPLQKRKDHIAKIATKIFLAKGYNNASLKDISDKTAISKAGMYHYFRSKEDILFYIIKTMAEDFMNKLRECIRECEVEHLRPEDALRKYINRYAYHLNRSRDIPLLILRERHQLTGKFKTELNKLEQEIFHGIRDELERVPKISKAYDLNVISFLIISMSHWIGYWLKPKEKLDLESVIAQNIEIIFQGIFKGR